MYFQNFLTMMAPQPLPNGGRGWAVPIDPAARVMHAGESPRSVAPSRPRSRLATSYPTAATWAYAAASTLSTILSAH
jgi:hypothetical protein